MYSSPRRHVCYSSSAAVGQPCEDLSPTHDTFIQTRRQSSRHALRVLLLVCVGVALLCAPAAAARSDDTTTAVRFDARYVVPEKAAVRENRLIGNFTSLVVDSLAWSTREGQDEVLDRLLGHPLASGTLAVIAPPPHEQTRYYSAATTPKAREAAAVKAAAAVAAATTAGTFPEDHRAAAAGGTTQERDDSSAKLHIIYTKGVPMTTADGAAPEAAEGAGANSRLKKFVSPSLPLIGRTAETASVPSISEVWRDIRSRSLLNQLRTKVLGGSTAQSSDAAVLEDDELFHNQKIRNPSAMPLQQLAKTATRSATAAAGVTVDRVVQATETLIEVHQTKARVPVTLTADQVTVIAFDAFEGNTLSAVIQLPNWRYDSGVDSSNCYGLYLTAEVRANNPYVTGVRSSHATTTAAAAASATTRDEGDWNDFFNEGYGYGTVTTSSTTRAPVDADNGEDDNEESFSSVWSSFAQMFDTSAFCEVKSSLGLRVSKVKATRTYYVVLKSWPQRYTPGMTDGQAATCRLDVFLDQTSAKQLKTLQIIFALVIPLLVVFVPLPFQLWRGDIIQSAMLDLDFADWMFYPPLLLRRKIVQGCVKLYESIKGCLTARRTARLQAELEARQRALADEMEAQFPTSGASQAQTAVAATAADAPAGPAVRGWGGGAGGGGWGVPPTLPQQQQQQQSEDASASTSVHVPMTTPPSPPHPVLVGGTAVNRPLYSDPQEEGPSTANSPLDPLLQAMEPAAAISSSSTAAAAAVQPVTRQDTHNSSTTSSRSSGRVALGDSFAESADGDIRFASDVNPRRRRALNAAASAASRVGASDDVLIEAAEPSPAEEDGVSPLQTAQHAMTREEREAARSTSEHPSVNQTQQRQQQQQSSHMVQHKLPETPEKKVKVADGGKEGAEDDEEEEERFCRICREDGSEEPLVAPCSCTGSVRWVHRSCLDRWRIESTKRNLTNVNKCEICKHDFTIGISRMTLFWRSSQNIINGALLFLTCFFAIFMIATLSHSTFGELSCVADYHNVAYKTMYMFEGITLSVFLYLLCVIVVLFAYLIVYSWFRSRPDVEAYIREAHVRPPFLTSRNVSMILLMSSTLTLQGLSLGYLIKYFLYSTSDIVWNWEASPLLGGMMFMLFMTVCLGFSVWLRDTVNRRRAARDGRVGQAEDVVIANPNDVDADANNNQRDNTNGRQEQQGNGGGPRNGADRVAEHGAANPTETEVNGAAAAASAAIPATATAPGIAPVVRGQAGDEDYTRQFAIPPEERVIRAFEYCPPRRTLPRAL